MCIAKVGVYQIIKSTKLYPKYNISNAAGWMFKYFITSIITATNY